MKNAMLRMSLIVLMLLLPLCGCAPVAAEAPASTQHASFAPAEPNVTAMPPESGTGGAVVWEQTDVFTTWSEKDAPGITRGGTPVSVPDSVMKMIPLVEFLLDYRTAYDFQNDDLQYFESIPVTNQHAIGNELYLWGLMAHLFCTYGSEHPAVKASVGGAALSVPEAAARDFLEVCFADYTPDFVLPHTPPERWLEKPVGYTGSDPGRFIVFQDGSYLCDAGDISFLTGSRLQYIITNYVESDASMYDLDILKLYGPDDYDVAIYRVSLCANSAPNVLGLAWRVAQIVRIDTSDLWAGQTESEG